MDYFILYAAICQELFCIFFLCRREKNFLISIDFFQVENGTFCAILIPASYTSLLKEDLQVCFT